MSYILDALQKTSADNTTEALPSPSQSASAGLSLTWKLAIGAVLATNLALLFLWQSERDPAVSTAAQTNPALAPPNQTAYPSGNRAPGAVPAAVRTQNQANATSGTASTKKKTLPGIASPRDLPPPKPAAAPANRTAARTFKPTGAPITIADAKAEENLPDTAIAKTNPRPARPTAQQSPAPTTAAKPPLTRQSRGVLQLSELSEAARESLYVLTFSFHIYADDADLRAVVVNGQRQSEGSKIIADNGQEFRLIEILETGVILQFDHKGTTQTVQIPVIEDWKNA